MNHIIYSDKLAAIASKGAIFFEPAYESKFEEKPTLLYVGPYGTLLRA